MAYFAEVDELSTVVRVLVVDETMPNRGLDWLEQNLGGTWIETDLEGGQRKNYAAIGDLYSPQLDAFIKPRPYKSWTLNETTCLWEAPVAKPEDDKVYQWDESAGSWLEVTGE